MRAGLMLAALCACAHEPRLVAANRARGPGSTVATAVERGVHLTIDTDAWPDRLPQRVTPIQVMLRNESGQPIAIRYRDFALVWPDGRALSALPAVEAEPNLPEETGTGGAGPMGPLEPSFAADDFWVAPPFVPRFPTLPPWSGPFEIDATYYQRAQALWPSRLPDLRMRRAGIPEGVLKPGGMISGFLYFEDIARPMRELRFTARLSSVRTGAEVATLAIPLRAQ